MALLIDKAPSGSAPGVWFIPAFRGNRSETEGQIAVQMRPLNAAQLQAKKERELARSRGNKIIAESRGLRNSVITDNVAAVEGIATEAGPVLDGRALVKAAEVAADAAIDDLLDEIYAAITDMSVLDEGRRPS